MDAAAKHFGVDSVIIVTQLAGAQLLAEEDGDEQLFGIRVDGERYGDGGTTSTVLVLSGDEMEVVCVRLVELLTTYGRGPSLSDAFLEHARKMMGRKPGKLN